MERRVCLQAVEYHTAGEPFRIISGGVGPIPGATMLEKRRYAMEHLDHLRRLLVNEPRGHADMYGGFVTDPVSPDGDLGVLFFHNAGFSTACGHGTIALVTAAIEMGMLPRRAKQRSEIRDLPLRLAAGPPASGEQRLVVDVPSGRLETIATPAPDGRVAAVRFRNVPSYVETPDLRVDVDGLGPLQVAIAYGGAFYALVDARRLGLPVEPASLPRFIACGRAIKATVEAVHLPAHPLHHDISGIYGVIFAEPAPPDEAWPSKEDPALPGALLRTRAADGTRHDRNVTIFADGEVDRSPCGSGTSARLAHLHATGQLALHQPLLHESIIGSRFTGRVVARTEEAGHQAVITEVEGSAHLTGYHTFILQPDDPLGTGFLLPR